MKYSNQTKYIIIIASSVDFSVGGLFLFMCVSISLAIPPITHYPPTTGPLSLSSGRKRDPIPWNNNKQTLSQTSHFSRYSVLLLLIKPRRRFPNPVMDGGRKKAAPRLSFILAFLWCAIHNNNKSTATVQIENFAKKHEFASQNEEKCKKAAENSFTCCVGGNLCI